MGLLLNRLVGTLPRTHNLMRLSHLRGGKVIPAQQKMIQLDRKNKKTLPWASNSRHERRVLQRRRQPTPTQYIYHVLSRGGVVRIGPEKGYTGEGAWGGGGRKARQAAAVCSGGCRKARMTTSLEVGFLMGRTFLNKATLERPADRPDYKEKGGEEPENDGTKKKRKR